MCGIAGYVGGGSTEALQAMARALRHRGPDDQGFYQAPGVGLAFRRLSIIDVVGGHQPLSNEDGSVWVMLNGEIYGFQNLRSELVSLRHVFKTQSDTEVIVHAYEQWGDACFEKLNGMFAIALWDARHSRLLLARDRLGKKPLYWTVKNGTLWFASEIKALLATGAVQREIDLISLGQYFRTDAVPTPRSIFKNVNKLEPASFLEWGGGQIKMRSFWSCPTQNLTGISPDEAVQGLRERLDTAVRERLISDVPLGLFLSGGIDSAVVAESAARQSSSKLKVFTIAFEDDSHDESSAARQVAQALDLDYRQEMLSADSALSMLEQAVKLLDEPLADPAILPQLLLARFTRREVTVALSGDGGDELLLGYQHIPAHLWAKSMAGVPTMLKSLMAKILWNIPASGGYFSLGFKTQRLARGLAITDPWSRDLAWRGAFTGHDLQALLRPEIVEVVQTASAELAMQSRAQEFSETGSDFWKHWSWAYLRTYLMDDVLVKVDRATMWYALEARAPILDQRVVAYLLQLPDTLKLGAWKNKRLFKELVRGRIPDNILERPKHGFGVPVAEWLNGPLAGKLQELTSGRFLSEQGIFNVQTVADLITQHKNGKIDRRKELWALFMFQLWYHEWAQKIL